MQSVIDQQSNYLKKRDRYGLGIGYTLLLGIHIVLQSV